MKMHNMAFGVGTSVKSVSSNSGGTYRPRRVVSGKAFSSIWSQLRNGLDALAGGLGIPLATLRQQFRNEGIDPDIWNRAIDRMLTENPEALDDDELMNNAFQQAEDGAKTLKPGVLIFGLIALLLLLRR